RRRRTVWTAATRTERRARGCCGAWFHKLAADVTLDGSMLDGALQGADAIRVVIGAVRERYDRQDFTFAGRWGDSGFIEDYTAEVRGRPLGCVHLVAINADGQRST